MSIPSGILYLQEIEDLLERCDVSELERSANTALVLTAEGRIGYVNPAWTTFAIDNEGADIGQRWGLGANWWSAIPECLQPFYQEWLEHAHRQKKPNVHEYECSSPLTIRRLCMHGYPYETGDTLMVHSLLIEVEASVEGRVPLPAVERLYREASGFIRQCAHCRRVHRVGSEQWDWVPDYVAHSPHHTSHGLCEPCFAYHYPS